LSKKKKTQCICFLKIIDSSSKIVEITH
jgi:hypothetical protein